MKKYCIETFEKHKSDVVGEETLGDPLIEQKHTNKPLSNMPTSNIQHLTSNGAITLIALIITIIVLLILAGVTLSMVMGNSGLFNKANLAKEQTQKSTAEETIKLAVLENKTKEAAGETALTDTELKEEIAGKLKDLGFTVADNNNDVTYYEDKTIKIEDYLKINGSSEDDDTTVEVTALDVQQHPELYYGKEVTNYTSANEQNNWKIFYSDGTHIFLITGDYINPEDSNKLNKSATGIESDGYTVYWTGNSGPEFQTLDSNVLTRFKATEYDLNMSNVCPGSKCVSTLLNPNNWSNYKDSEDKAEYAIGGPTIEMWIDSWNNLYENVDGKLYRKPSTSIDNPGYYIGTSEDPTSLYINPDEIRQRDGFQNRLYFPYTETLNSTNGYFIASPASANSGSLFSVDYYGGIVYYNYGQNSGHEGLRPVVSLKSGKTVRIMKTE